MDTTKENQKYPNKEKNNSQQGAGSLCCTQGQQAEQRLLLLASSKDARALPHQSTQGQGPYEKGPLPQSTRNRNVLAPSKVELGGEEN